MKIKFSIFLPALSILIVAGCTSEDVNTESGQAGYQTESVTNGAAALKDSKVKPKIGSAFAVKPGGVFNFQIELADDFRRIGGQLSPVTTADVSIAVPEQFDVTRDWPVLIVSGTSDPGYTGNRRAMRSFVEPGLAAGWIVLAVDPAKPNSDAANDNLILRYSLIKAVLLDIQASWPESGRWPIAFGGFSGGAKASGFLALISAIDGRLPIGIFLGGCNEATPADALNIYHRPQPGFASVPVFLSSGINDTIASPSQQRNVKEDLLHAGFTRVRLESYQGEHHLSPEHLQAALQWFDAEAARQPE